MAPVPSVFPVLPSCRPGVRLLFTIQSMLAREKFHPSCDLPPVPSHPGAPCSTSSVESVRSMALDDEVLCWLITAVHVTALVRSSMSMRVGDCCVPCGQTPAHSLTKTQSRCPRATNGGHMVRWLKTQAKGSGASSNKSSKEKEKGDCLRLH